MDNFNLRFFKPGKYQKVINNDISQCLTCEHKCKINKNKTGKCQTRININGTIFTFVYGLIPALSYNHIEKKPLFHFYPGSKAITIGTYGCNFNCFWCQNHHLSHPNELPIDLAQESTQYFTADEIINLALKNNCQGTSISFNEPTLLFEYSLEIFKLAKKNGLYNTYVTNGYMTEEVLKDLVEHGLDAMNIDIKGNNAMVKQYCGIDNEHVWKTAKLAKDLGVHVEITTLLIEGFNTDHETIKEISGNILTKLDKSVPLHLTRAFPQFKSLEYGFIHPTPISSLKAGHKIAKDTGLDYVYLGNLSSSDYENTYCPKCQNLLIKRSDYKVTKSGLNREGKCNVCGFQAIKFL